MAGFTVSTNAYPEPMGLPRRWRELLEHVARAPDSCLVAFRVSTDARMGESVLACLHEYFAGVTYPGGPWRPFLLELLRSRDHTDLRALAKRLGVEYHVAVREAP